MPICISKLRQRKGPLPACTTYRLGSMLTAGVTQELGESNHRIQTSETNPQRLGKRWSHASVCSAYRRTIVNSGGRQMTKDRFVSDIFRCQEEEIPQK